MADAGALIYENTLFTQFHRDIKHQNHSLGINGELKIDKVFKLCGTLVSTTRDGRKRHKREVDYWALDVLTLASLLSIVEDRSQIVSFKL